VCQEAVYDVSDGDVVVALCVFDSIILFRPTVETNNKVIHRPVFALSHSSLRSLILHNGHSTAGVVVDPSEARVGLLVDSPQEEVEVEMWMCCQLGNMSNRSTTGIMADPAEQQVPASGERTVQLAALALTHLYIQGLANRDVGEL